VLLEVAGAEGRWQRVHEQRPFPEKHPQHAGEDRDGLPAIAALMPLAQEQLDYSLELPQGPKY
jgi:hypothetical protein